MTLTRIIDCESSRVILRKTELESSHQKPWLESPYHWSCPSAAWIGWGLFSAVCSEASAPVAPTLYRRSQGGLRGHGTPKFLEHMAILCFERRFSKQNSVIRLNSFIFPPPKFFGLPNFFVWLRHCHSKVAKQHRRLVCIGFRAFTW